MSRLPHGGRDGPSAAHPMRAPRPTHGEQPRAASPDEGVPRGDLHQHHPCRGGRALRARRGRVLRGPRRPARRAGLRRDHLPQHHDRALHRDARCLDVDRRRGAGAALAPCSTASRSTSSAFDGTRLAADEASRPTTCWWSRPTAPTCAPARACTASSTRSTRRSTSTRSSRSPTPVASTPASTSPTSRPRSRSRSRRPSTGRSSPTPPTPEPRLLGDGYARWDFAATPPLSTYITALVAGPYHVVRDEYVGPHGTYPLGLFCRASLAEHLDADDLFTVTKQGFEFFEESFGTPYPFGKYDQLFVPEFNAGAMENAGCVTILEDYVFRSRVTDSAYEPRANTILHELAHMWFGDLVTMTWWDDLWLNESFAEWAAHHSSVERDPLHRRVDHVPQPAQGLGLPPGPAALDPPDRRRHGRPRGGRGELRRHHLREGRLGAPPARGVGRREGVPRRAPRRTSPSTPGATPSSPTCSASSRRAAAATCRRGRPSGSRPPASTCCAPRSRSTHDGRYTSVVVVQEPPTAARGRPARAALAPHRRRPLRRGRRRGSSARAALEIDVVGERTEVPELVGVPAARPAAAQRRRPHLRQDPPRRALAGAPSSHSLGTLPDSLPRALVWGAAWDMTRDAEMSIARLPGAGRVGPADARPTSASSQVLLARRRPRSSSTPTRRTGPATATGSPRSPLRLLADAVPGSDHQLAFARAFAAAARTPEHAAVVRAWLSGERARRPRGRHRPALDAAAAARRARRRATRPRSTPSSSATTPRPATARPPWRARPCRPPEAKERAYAASMDDRRRAAQRAAHRDDRGLRAARPARPAPGVPRPLLRRAARRCGPSAPTRRRSRSRSGFYPTLLVEQETLDLTDGVPRARRRALGRAPARARRRRDGVERSLRCRLKDA